MNQTTDLCQISEGFCMFRLLRTTGMDLDMAWERNGRDGRSASIQKAVLPDGKHGLCRMKYIRMMDRTGRFREVLSGKSDGRIWRVPLAQGSAHAAF